MLEPVILLRDTSTNVLSSSGLGATIAVPTGLPEAPSDSLVYGRQDGDWVEVPTGGSSWSWESLTRSDGVSGSVKLGETSTLYALRVEVTLGSNPGTQRYVLSEDLPGTIDRNIFPVVYTLDDTYVDEVQASLLIQSGELSLSVPGNLNPWTSSVGNVLECSVIFPKLPEPI